MCYATLIRFRRYATSPSAFPPSLSLLHNAPRFFSSSSSQVPLRASAVMVAHPKDEAYLSTVIPKRVKLFEAILAQQLAHRQSLPADPIK